MKKLTQTLNDDNDIVEPEGPTFKIFSGALKAFERESNGVTRKMLSCTASSTVQDLHGDNMTDECVMNMAPQAKAKQMTIFLNHSYKWPEDIAGKTADARVIQRSTGEERVFDLDLDIELNEANPRAVESWTAIKEQGIKAGISIGAVIEDYAFKDEDEGFWGGLEIRSVNLLEASIVGIPANQRSWVVNGIEALGAPKAVIRKAAGLPEKPVKKQTDPDPVPDPEPPEDDPAEPQEPPTTGVKTIKCTECDSSLVSSKDGFLTHEADGSHIVTYESNPEASPEPETPEDESDESEDEAAEETPSVEAAADAVATLKSAGADEGLLEIVLGFLEGATEEVATLRKTIQAKDEELAQARQDVQKAAEAIELLAKTPIGRKAQFAAPVDNFRSRFAGYYDEGLLKVLEERNQTNDE